MDNARSFAIQRFAVDLLESIDNFDRALLAVPPEKANAPESPENKDLLDLVAGLKMTQNVLMNTLNKHGLERYDPMEKDESGKPQKFDPNVHEATFMTKNESMEDGDVMYTQSKGFILHGRVLRVSISVIVCLIRLTCSPQAAKVGVVRNS
jgi:molecular chaperone GrpE